MSIAVYPGSFDPITLGHLNVIRRSAGVFDKVIVCVMVNSDKHPMFSREERVELIERTTVRYKNVVVDTSSDLLVKFVRDRGANVIVKGLRAVSDFDWEFQMALINKKIDPGIETMFLAADEKYMFLSSTAVKEMAKYGADLRAFVPAEIITDVYKKAEMWR